MFSSVWTLLALIYLTLTSWKLERFAHPWIICGVESLTMLFWFAGFIAAAVFLSDLITCAGRACSSAKAATVFAAFECKSDPSQPFEHALLTMLCRGLVRRYNSLGRHGRTRKRSCHQGGTQHDGRLKSFACEHNRTTMMRVTIDGGSGLRRRRYSTAGKKMRYPGSSGNTSEVIIWSDRRGMGSFTCKRFDRATRLWRCSFRVRSMTRLISIEAARNTRRRRLCHESVDTKLQSNIPHAIWRLFLVPSVNHDCSS